MKSFNILLLGLLLAFGQAQADAIACNHAHLPKTYAIEKVGGQSAQITRDSITHFLAKNPDIPSFIKHTERGDVPVIMVNSETYKKLKPLLERSAGFMFVQQVGYKNDHGLMRVGKNIIDADTPGARGFGEIHETGLAWKNLDSYLPRRGDDSYVMIETGYLLPDAEYNVINYYQRLRRAAIFRIPFTFGGANSKKLPNTIESSGENCFGFCKGATVESDVTKITRKMIEMGATDVPTLMQRPEVLEFLSEARAQVLTANLQKDLSWDMFHSNKNLKKLSAVIPEALSPKDKKIFMNWILALEASQRYSLLKNIYKVTNDGGYNDLQNGTTSFVLIYDNMVKAESFANGTYESPGVFYNWKNTDQSPLQK